MEPRRPMRWLSAVLLSAQLLPTLLLSTMLLISTPAWALKADKSFTHYVLNTWSIQDGLPQITALSLAQDRVGYLWVGTQSGLARFDGVRFVTYTPEDTPALPGIWIGALLSDRHGRLWIGTYKGLAFYDGQQFHKIIAADPVRYPSLNILALIEQADGQIVVGSSEGVFRVVNDRLVHVTGPKPALSLLSREDGLWVGSTGGVERIAANGVIARLPLPSGSSSAAVSQVVDTQGQLWAGTSQGLFTLMRDGWYPVQANPTFDRSPVTALLADHDANLWVGSNEGLARFRNGVLTEFIPDSNPRAFAQVISALEDREGNLWLGSQLNGLARLWNGWTRRYSVGEGLNDRIVWSLSPDPDGRHIWVGSNDGLSLFDQGHFQLVVPGNALPHPHAYNVLAERVLAAQPDVGNPKNDGVVGSLPSDATELPLHGMTLESRASASSAPDSRLHIPDSQVWIGTRRGLVLWRDGHVQSPPEVAPMARAQINGIVRPGDGSTWFPTSEGLFHLVDGKMQHIGQEQGLQDPRVRVMAFDKGGQVLLGTQSGLWELRDGKAQRPLLQTGLPPDMDVSALLRLHDGRLVIGSLAERLLILAGNHWHTLGPEQGLPANSPFFLAEDAHGWLWIAGIRGVSRVRVADLPTGADGSTTRAVHGELVLNERGDPNSGQQGFCCNGAGMSKGFLRDDVLWLPSRDGVVALDTRDIVRNPLPPALLIERLHTPQGWRTLPTSGVDRMLLPASARDLGFEFTALSFQDPASVQLRYRLQGYDKGWHRLEDPRRRSANYTNLPPGKYTFEVIGANNAGIWNPNPALLRFRIQPLFHETWLFRLLLAALLAMLVYAGYRYQVQRHAQQRTELEAQVQARTRELHAANAHLEKASQTDPLTGLRNRRYLANQIPADLAYYDRERKRSGEFDQVLVFALVDLDFFKRVNDEYGHKAGDQVLLQVAQVLGSLARSSDYLARWGGEEFLLVFRPMGGRFLETIGHRIRTAVSTHEFDIGLPQPLHLTCSVGMSEYPLFRDAQQGLGWEQMVELADAALYWVKGHGRDGWAAFRPTLHTDLATLMRDLQQSVTDLAQADRLQLLTSRPVPNTLAPDAPAPDLPQ
jgi:diguanylate cyclase (GGDEF)-like protein